MKVIRRVPISILLLLIPVLSIGAVSPFRMGGRTNADRLRVRTEPTLNGEIVASLAVGTDLEILDVTAEEMAIGTMSARWYKVRTLPGEDEIEGWSYGFFIDVDQEELLARAIWLGRPLLVRELIGAGAHVNTVLTEEGEEFTQYDEYSYSSTLLIEAVRAENAEILEILLASGADPDAEYSHGEPGGTERSNSLISAVELGNHQLVSLLVESGANLDAGKTHAGGGGDRFQVTPLSAAIQRADRFLVEYLLRSGADVNLAVRYQSLLRDDSWKSPLDMAEEAQLPEIADMIRAFGGEKAETR